MPNKRISLSIYSLPKTFYVKYNILVLFLIVFANALTIFFVWDIQHKFFEDPIVLVIILSLALLSIYADLDVMHALMKKQFIEVTHKYIRVKKLSSDITLNWYEIKSVEEIYSIKVHNLVGAKLKKRDKDKRFLSNGDITINFNKYANIDITDFFEVLHRKKSSNFRMRF